MEVSCVNVESCVHASCVYACVSVHACVHVAVALNWRRSGSCQFWCCQGVVILSDEHFECFPFVVLVLALRNDVQIIGDG